ncbi:MAG: hypothetical protein KDD61_00335 [Bdellovibrionales bacterium]|nr:hypothetical protein [Bdellovibrionales bacterium]
MILLYLFLLSGYGSADSICANSVKRSGSQIALGDIRPYKRRPVTTQCEGTCYFEAFAAALESEMSIQRNRPTFVSRLQLFANLIEARLEQAETGFLKLDDSKNGQIDFVSYDSPNRMFNALTRSKDVYYRETASQREVYLENRQIETLYMLISRELYLMKRGRLKGVENPEERKRIQDEITKELKKKTKRFLEENFSWEQYHRTRIKGGFRRHIFDSLIVESEGRYHFVESAEREIVEALERGSELVLTASFIESFLQKKDGINGFFDINSSYLKNKSTYLNGKKINRHAVVIVDVIKDSDGHIHYLVVRNSEGYSGRSSNGYYYISMAYLKEVGRFLIQIIDVQLEE